VSHLCHLLQVTHVDHVDAIMACMPEGALDLINKKGFCEVGNWAVACILLCITSLLAWESLSICCLTVPGPQGRPCMDQPACGSSPMQGCSHGAMCTPWTRFQPTACHHVTALTLPVGVLCAAGNPAVLQVGAVTLPHAAPGHGNRQSSCSVDM
jgi:hypothetical protein